MSIQQAVNAPVTIALADGKDYQFAKVGMTILCEFCDWINRSMERKVGDLVDFEEMSRWMQSIKGMRWLLWRSLREHHTKLQIGQVGDLIAGFDQMTEIINAIVDLPEQEAGAGHPPLKLDLSTGADFAP